jgi:hypothetical protein
MVAPRATTEPVAEDHMLPEHALRVTGAARLLLVINLGSFVAEEDADAFRHLRGSESFAAALRELRPQPPFGPDDAALALEQDAYTLRIFRSRLLYNHFFPTYRLAWDARVRERLVAAGCADVRAWQRWTPRVRLTRNGLAAISLEQPLDDLPLIRAVEQVLELPAAGAPSHAQDQWTLGMLILEIFLDALGRRITLHQNGRELPIRFAAPAAVKHTLRLDRYLIYNLTRVERDGRLLTPEELKRDYARMLAAFMEGTLVAAGDARRLPLFAADQAHALADGDVSSWAEELCLFTGEGALIYTPLIGRGLAYIGGPLGLDAQAYSTYWAGIVRGVEHIVAFRSEVQQAERRTTDLLSYIPALTRKVTDGDLHAEDVAVIDHLATGLADIFDSLPEQRSMAVSATAFRADYVRRKFDALLRTLAVQETLDLVNTNVEQLNFFLSYYNDMRLQWQGQRTNSLGVTFALVVLFMAISSFLSDTFNVVEQLRIQDRWTILAWIVTFAVGLALLWLLVRLGGRLIHRRLRGARRDG